MTTEEIEKAAKEYANKFFSIRDIWMYYFSGKQVHDIIKDTFMLSAEFINKYWQEKTRWIPIEERLPDRDKHVLWKTQGNGYFVMKLGKDTNFEWFKTYAKVTHWREIE